ncbi:beta-lactamase family protein [Streptomyces sp. NBC_01433]|uniref:serine hydrolase domain-containing protein n=1 Tax=Streptomyces sp. NBC_01433 TaxID=2903864 RepID=UPI002254058F|nr:serine hydrolase domain-containing protein [Streptomyces sp. NBC_01433]MCX4676525.1 beta-lactamase family protein [Streptomyces sp. NBC_01433]
MSRRSSCAVVAALCLALAAPTASAASTSDASVSASAVSASRPGADARQLALEALTGANAVSAIAEVRDGSGVWRGTTGVSDLVREAPVRGDGRFRIGSVTKMFVAATTLQLVGEHRLGLEDSVESHLPGLVPGGQDITVRQLLNHRTGLFDVINESTEIFPAPDDPDGFRNWIAQGGLNRTFTARELVTKSVAHPPHFEPGTKWAYSNTNFSILGLIIEEVTGHSYAQEIQRRILRPLGMTKTSLPGSSAEIPGRHAHGYWTTVDGIGTPDVVKTDVDVTRHNASWAGSGGEMISTTDDLVRFEKALLRGKLLRPEQQREMTTMLRTDPDSDRLEYGMGLARTPLSCTTVTGHSGAVLGYGTHLWGTADRQVALSYTPRGDAEEQTAQSKAVGAFLEAAFCGSR